MAPLSLQGGAYSAAASHKTEAGEGHSVKVKDMEREGEHCTVQISALNIQGRHSIFFFYIILFLAVPATPKKQRATTSSRITSPRGRREKQTERELNSLGKSKATISCEERERGRKREGVREGGREEIIK